VPLTYLTLGMNVFGATVHALTHRVHRRIFRTYDRVLCGPSLGNAEYAAIVFMVCSRRYPFVRLCAIVDGNPLALQTVNPQVAGGSLMTMCCLGAG